MNGTKDTTVTVYNTGSSTETIQIFVSPPYYSNKSFVTLQPGDSAVVQIQYKPIEPGSNTATICFVISSPYPCYDLSCVVAEGTAPSGNESAIAANALDAGTLVCQSSEDTSVFIQAVGTSALTIDSIAITGADANAFQIINTAFPLTVAPGAPGTPVNIRFTPRHTGVSTAAMLVYSGNSTNSPFTIPLTGDKAAAGITVNDQTINFGDVTVNTLRDSVVVIRNIGTTQETLQLQTSAPFSLDESSVTIAPGDSVAVTIHFQLTQLGGYTDTLSIAVSEPCYFTASVVLQGTAATPATQSGNIYVCLTPQPNIAAPLTDINAAIVLMNTILYPVDTVAFMLQWNPAALELGTITSPLCAVTILPDSIGKADVLLQGCSFPLQAGTLCTAVFDPLASSADTTHTQITLDSIKIYPLADNLTGNGCTVPVTVLPPCGTHGIIYTNSATSLSQNFPNPFAGTTTIHVTLAKSESAGAQLLVYNILGERVADLTNQLSANGDVTFAAGTLSAGVYYYVLQTAEGRWAREMFVVK